MEKTLNLKAYDKDDNVIWEVLYKDNDSNKIDDFNSGDVETNYKITREENTIE